MVSLDTDEKILHRIRRHWFVMLRVTVGSVCVALFPVLVWMVLSALGFEDARRIAHRELYLFLYVIGLIFIWMFYFLRWTDYYLDVWLITNKRIIDIEQRGIFRRKVTSITYDRIQDVTVVTDGVIQTLFHFGKIHLQTAGERRKIILRDAPMPEEVKKIILSISEHKNRTHIDV